MRSLPLALLILLSSVTVVRPFGWGLFDYDDDDEILTNSTLASNSTERPPSRFNCQAIDDMLTSFQEFMQYLEQTFNPWYEPPPTPMPTTTPAPSTPKPKEV